jgi:hypothetical protein
MSDLDDVELAPVLPAGARQFRRRIRIGFALFALATGLVLAYEVALVLAALPGLYSDTSRVSDAAQTIGVSTMIVDGIDLSLLVAALVLLYGVPYGQRWRGTSTILLGVVGAEIAFLSLRVAGGMGTALAVVNELGMALCWVELWMIAVLAAEAAEAAKRPELTFQTEVAGRWIIGGGSAWLLSAIWSFDPSQFSDSSANLPQDPLTVLFTQATLVLQLFALVRITSICIGLVNAYVLSQEPEA